MRIAERGDAASEEISRFDELIHHGLVGRTILPALLAFQLNDRETFEAGADVRVAPELINGVGDVRVDTEFIEPRFVSSPYVVVVFAVTRRCVHETRSGLSRDMVTIEQWHLKLIAT
jgi:hypothetical protein